MVEVDRESSSQLRDHDRGLQPGIDYSFLDKFRSGGSLDSKDFIDSRLPLGPTAQGPTSSFVFSTGIGD